MQEQSDLLGGSASYAAVGASFFSPVNFVGVVGDDFPAQHVEFLRSRGFSVVMSWEGRKISFPRVAASCDYLRPIRFEDVVEITVRLHRLGRKSVTYAFEFLLGGEVIARGRRKMAL